MASDRESREPVEREPVDSVVPPEYQLPSSENLGFDPFENVLPEEELRQALADRPTSEPVISEPFVPEAPFASDWTPGADFVFDTTPTQPTIANEPSWTDGVASGMANAERQELSNAGFVTPEAQQTAMDAAAQVPSMQASLDTVPGELEWWEKGLGGALDVGVTLLTGVGGAGNVARDLYLNAAGADTEVRTYRDPVTGEVIGTETVNNQGLSPTNDTVGGFSEEMGDVARRDIEGYQESMDQVAAATAPPLEIPTSIAGSGGTEMGSGASSTPAPTPATDFTTRPTSDLTGGFNAMNETPGARDINWYRSNPFYQQLTQAGGGMNPLTAYSSADAQALLAGNMLGGAATRYAGADPALASAMQAFQAAQAGAAGQAGIQGQALGAMQQGMGTLAGAQQAAQVGSQQAMGQGLFSQGAQLAQEQALAARQGMQAGQQGLAGYQQALSRTPQQQYGSFLGAQQQMLGQAGAAADAATSLFGQSAMAQAAQQSNDARRMMEQRLATSGMMGTQSGAALGAITEAASRPYAEAMTNITAQRANAFQNAYNPQAQAMLQNTLAAPERQLAGVSAGQQVFGQGVQGLGQSAQSLFGAGQGVLSAGQLGLGQAGALGQIAGQQGQLGQGMLGAGQLGLSMADMQRLAGQGMLSQASGQQQSAAGLGALGGQYGNLAQLMQQRGNTLADLLSQQSQQALVAPQFQQRASQEDKTYDLLGGGMQLAGNIFSALAN